MLDDQKPILWAPAATIYGDKASFYNCSFFGVQDTLTDAQGRHYYKSCYIEGAIDFIWGRGQSVYEVRNKFACLKFTHFSYIYIN